MTEQADSTLVLDTFQRAGYSYLHVSCLVDVKYLSTEQISILLQLLPVVDDLGIKETLVRAAAVKFARGIAELPLIKCYQSLPTTEKTESVRWAIGNTIYYLDPTIVKDEILKIILNPKEGSPRQRFVASLWKVSDNRIFATLVYLLDDSQVRGHAIEALRKLRNPAAVPWIMPYRSDPKAWIRREAKKAIEVLSGYGSR